MIKPGAVKANTPRDSYTPSLWQFLFGGKPGASRELDIARAGLNLFAPEVSAVEDAIQPPGPEPDRAPGGAFDQQLNQGGQDDVLQNTIQQFQFIIVDASVAGQVPGFFPADVDANTLAIVPRASDEAGNIIESATDAIIYFKINQQSNLMLPLSYAQERGGPAVNDLGSIQGNIRRLWLSVAKPAQDPSRKYVVLVLMKDAAFSQPGGAGSFSTATVSSAPSSSIEASGAGGAVAPSGGGTTSGGTSSGGGTTSGGSACFSGNTLVVTKRGDIPIEHIAQGDLVLTASGLFLPADLVVHDGDFDVCEIASGEYSTLDHLLLKDSKWVPAGDIFPSRTRLKGKVFHLRVRSVEPLDCAMTHHTERSFKLASAGMFAHNVQLGVLK